MIVTRGAGETDSTLGGDVVKQLISQPKALFIAGGFMFAFGLIPGFPPLPFLVLGTVAVGAGFAVQRQNRAEAPKDSRKLPAMAPAVQKVSVKRKDSGDEFSVTVPLLMDVAAASQTHIDAEAMNEIAWRLLTMKAFEGKRNLPLAERCAVQAVTGKWSIFWRWSCITSCRRHAFSMMNRPCWLLWKWP